jgi:hypothetical protein
VAVEPAVAAVRTSVARTAAAPVAPGGPAAKPGHRRHRAGRHGGAVARADGPALAPSGGASATASAAGSAAAATAFLGLLALLAFAAPRLGGVIRLLEGRAPMPPLLALPERPG